KPAGTWWVRTNKQHEITTAVLLLKEENKTYLVPPSLWSTLSKSEKTFTPVKLVGAVNKAGDYFIWLLRLPTADGRDNPYNKTARDAAVIAYDRWVRVTSSESSRRYDIQKATGDFGDPVWPKLSFQELLKIAYRDSFIDSYDHPVLLRLRGIK